MPSLSTARRVANAKNNEAKTIGQIYKEQSDFLMEETFFNDPQAKVCYIYDWKHDDSPNMNVGMTYENTTKTQIDAKIIISTYGSIDKDAPTLQCQFRSSQKEYFDEGDELFYMEKYRKKYQLTDVFVGMYLDVPDKKGVYHRYLICMKDVEKDFQKYFILPCDYNLQFVVNKGNQRTKEHMWCVLKSQSSYNSGIWVDQYFATQQNQELLFIPTNEISDMIYYVSEGDENNQRVIVDIPNYSIKNWTPNTWVISKVERVNVRGRTRLTLYQKSFNSNTDYIEKDDNGNIIGMWANYFDTTTPIDPDDLTPTLSPETNVAAIITSTASNIKVAGSYKTLNLTFYNELKKDITSDFENAQITWNYTIDENSYNNVIEKNISYKQKMIKLPEDYDLLGKTLTISCIIFREDIGYVYSEKFQITITE